MSHHECSLVGFVLKIFLVMNIIMLIYHAN